MKPAKLHRVTYFKGKETRTLSKHLRKEDAVRVGNRFITGLKDKRVSKGETDVLVSLSHFGSDSETFEDKETVMIFALTSRTRGPLEEGVSIEIVSSPDPSWDYPKYSAP